MTKTNSRRSFIKKTAGASAAIVAGGVLPGFSARSYGRILGSNEKIRVSVMGVNSRGLSLSEEFALQDNCEVIHICDVDSRAMQNAINKVYETAGNRPRGYGDFRNSLESRDVDALVIATPDHWHAPATLLGLKAGKHVYVEKPLSHNPNEGEMLVTAGKKFGRAIQMGTQRRSRPSLIQAIDDVKSGLIGKAYFGKSWYSNTRGPIGTGMKVPVPEWLNWDLWQGPAPRKEYHDNYLHYNWHWFWQWGTGEALNNGTHFVDLLRWGLGVDFPSRVSSNGGRYQFNDDWETPDTQVISMDFKSGATITWEGRSCNGAPVEGDPVGCIFYGDNGSLKISAGNDYTVYDLKGNIVKEVKDQEQINALDRTARNDAFDRPHIQNFFNAIKTGEKPHSDVENGYKSTLLVQLGNIAQRMGRSLETDPETGHILHDQDAIRLWSRDYEKGWEMKI